MAWSRISKSGCREGCIRFFPIFQWRMVLHFHRRCLCFVIRGGHHTGRETGLLQITSVHDFSLQCTARSAFIHSSFYWRKTCHQTASPDSLRELFIVSRDKQSLVIHATLRCTIGLVEHFLTHSWLPPSHYDSEAQGEKGFRLQSILLHVSMCRIERRRQRANASSLYCIPKIM